MVVKIYYTNKIEGPEPWKFSGFTISNGEITVQKYSKKTSVGVILTERDSDGYAMVALGKNK